MIYVTEPATETCNPDRSNDLIYMGFEHIKQETLRLKSVSTSAHDLFAKDFM
ncbi:MAG: hypothetical protein WCF65_09445 [Parachlamydiaceae bacterium]